MVLIGEEGLEYDLHVVGMLLEHVWEPKYLECSLHESGTYETDCRRKVASGRRIAGGIRSLVNASGLRFE